MLKKLLEDVLRAVFVVGETPTEVEHELPEIIRKLSKNIFCFCGWTFFAPLNPEGVMDYRQG